MGEVLAGRNRWTRQPGDFAVRMEVGDIKTFFTKGVAIDAGTRGLLFQDGAPIGVLQPGYHTLQDLPDRLKALFVGSPISVLLVDAGDVPIPLPFDGLRTSDEDEVGAEVQVLVGLASELDFFVNAMHGAAQLGVGDLQARFLREARGVMQSIVHGCRSDELYGNRELTDRIEDELGQALARSFQRLGLAFQHVEFVDFRGGAYEAIRAKRGAVNRGAAEHDVERDKAQLERKVRELATDQRMAQIRSERDFADFLKQCEQEAGLRDLLRQQEREELWRQYQERKDDHAAARAQLLATLAWQRKRERLARQMEYQRDLVLNRQELDTLARDHRLKEVEREHQSKLAAAERDFQAELNRTRQTRKSDLEHRAATFDQELSEVAREGQLGVDLQKQWEDLKQKRQQQAVDLELHKQKGEFEVRNAEEQARHEREKDRLAALSQMSVEALIVASDSEKAALLSELKRTETLSGFTEEQILAMAAGNSPAVAQAFAEKFRAAGQTEHRKEVEQLYERMLREQQQSSRDALTLQQENMKAFRELMVSALETQRDTAVAAARGAQPAGPAIVYPPPGSGASTVVTPAAGAGSTSIMIDCPQCRSKSPSGSQWCGNCGMRLA
jgi:hypothetical protein